MSVQVVSDAEESKGISSITIAKLTPISRDTEAAFSQVVEHHDLSRYHRDFIQARQVSPNSVLSESPDVTDSDYESDRPVHTLRHGTLKTLWSGHYRLSFDHP